MLRSKTNVGAAAQFVVSRFGRLQLKHIMIFEVGIKLREASFVMLLHHRCALAAALCLGLSLSFHANEAHAQQASPADSTLRATESDTLPAPVIDENAANARMFLDKVEVLGTLAKPQALFIIPGQDPRVDGIEIDRSFFREIFRPYEKDYHPANTRRYLKEQAVW